MTTNSQHTSHAQQLLRRTFLRGAGIGLGAAALQSMLAGTANASKPLEGPHFPPKAKRVIFLCMAGGPSHLETFDEKPKLAEMDGKPMPATFTDGQPIAQLQGKELKCLGPQFKFRSCGESGLRIAEVLPKLSEVADDLCLVRSMHTDQINHDPAHTVMNTGTSISGRPSMGAWVTYGLGSEADDMPGFVVLTSRGGRNPQPIASRQWGAGFLPSRFQGVEFRSAGDPVHYVRPPQGVDSKQQRELVDTIRQLDQRQFERVQDPEIETRLSQFELAFRMQASVPKLMDFADERQETLDLYGVKGSDGSFAANCLLARRLAQRGVRFIHLYHRGWDHHGDLVHYMKMCSGFCDGPAAALIKDLKRLDMLKDTLVIWGGEFGRTPMFQGKGAKAGRDHHIRGFSMCLAGGGVKGGATYGATDELGYNAEENRVHVRDFHATMLHLLGMDHNRLSVKYQGLHQKLTGVEDAHVVKDILA